MTVKRFRKEVESLVKRYNGKQVTENTIVLRVKQLFEDNKDVLMDSWYMNLTIEEARKYSALYDAINEGSIYIRERQTRIKIDSIDYIRESCLNKNMIEIGFGGVSLSVDSKEYDYIRCLV